MNEMRFPQTHITRKERFRGLIVLLAHIMLIVVVMCFHEPWFDEAESWLIARDSTLYELIFVRPHYEGHPSLWWLLLALPSKLGISYELGLKGVQLVFVALYAYLIIFHAPFPRIVRYVMPFTYFPFFQLGVLSRPYSMMLVATILSAMTWAERDEHPAAFCVSLCFLCLSSAYGLLMAGGIAIVWTVQLARRGALFESRIRTLSMLALLVLALFVVYTIMPRADTYAAVSYKPMTAAEMAYNLVKFALFLPSEVFFSSYAADGTLNSFNPGTSAAMAMAACSLALWSLCVWLGRERKTLSYLVVPYAFIAVFGSVKYFWIHHITVLYMLFVFFAWVSFRDGPIELESVVLKRCSLGFVAVGMICGINWTLFCVMTDIQQPYALGRDLAACIEENNLQDKVWISTWQRSVDEASGETVDNTHEYNFYTVEANAYFASNLQGDNLGGLSFLDHRIPTHAEVEADYALMRSEHIDYVVGLLEKDAMESIDLTTGLSVDKIFECDRVWKTRHNISDVFILKHE